MSEFDSRDADIVAARMLSLNATPLDVPRVGDWVEFSDGVARRIGYIWPDTVQTSDGGTYYLGNGHVSMSGPLHTGVPVESLTFTGQQRDGAVWLFHHDVRQAHNGVDTVRPFRVFSCSLPSTATR